jgi:uncharacterized membrane protein AbrB (regulator of aidB expression)
VVVLQFVRLVMGVGMFPAIIRLMDGGPQPDGRKTPGRSSAHVQPLAVLATLTMAAIAGVLGGLSPVPSDAMAFATLGEISLLLWRAGYFKKKEAILAVTPAGAGDMALISETWASKT